MASMETLTTWEALDRKLAEAAEASKISDDKMREVFQSFRMEYPTDLPSDPGSPEYRSRQNDLYEKISQRKYSAANEHTSFDVESASTRPFPFYTGSCTTVSTHLILVATLIRLLDLPPGAEILEFGPGWGNTTIFLAQMGYKVRAYDIEPNFVDLIRRRADRLGLELEVDVGGFLDIDKFDKQFDAIIFFECFHHCSDHIRLIDGLHKCVKPGGKVIFGAEPILQDFPVPWGLRLDGESLWAVRNFGWLELGFREDYFLATMEKYGWTCEKHKSLDAAFVNFYVATRFTFPTLDIHAGSDTRLMSHWAERADEGLSAGPGEGYLCFGPYVPVPGGDYVAEVELHANGEGWVKLEIGAGFDKPFAFSDAVSLLGENSKSKVLTLRQPFSLDRRVSALEVRVLGHIRMGSVTITRCKIQSNALSDV